MSVLKRVAGRLQNPAWVAFTWFGMTAAISLLATPVRFASDTMTRPVALDVARVVFSALNKAELVALVLLLIIIRVSRAAKPFWMFGFALALIVLVQSAWLIPELSARTDMILAGSEPPPSAVHGIYSTLELLKLLLLGWLGFTTLGGPAGDARGTA